MARSRAESPALPARQASSVPPENTTWSTGQSALSKGVAARAAPGVETAKPVALRTTSGAARANSSSSVAAASGSLRLVT